MQKTEKHPANLEQEPKEVERGKDKTHSDLVLAEAALYVAGRPLDMNEICSVLKTRSKNKARKILNILIKDYRCRTGALEILELKDERFVLQLRSEFTPLVKKLVNRPLLSVGPLKTLSYVAYRQPVSQKRVIDNRGHHAYGHVKMLKEMGLIASKKMGRSTVLETTEYFADYFALSHDTAALKKELKRFFDETQKQQDNSSAEG